MLYFLRHGNSEANEAGVYAGAQMDSKLSAAGRSAFEKIATSISQQFTSVYVSTLSRSVESGEIILQHAVNKPLLVKDERINELDFGFLTGKPYQFFDTKELYEKFSIESKHVFHDRIQSFYDEIIEKSSREDILVVGHSGIGMMLTTIAQGKPVDKYNNFELSGGRLWLIK